MFEYGPSSYEQKKTPFGGGFCSRGPNVKNQFFGKKYLVKFFEKNILYFVHLMRNFFLILKWFYFLSFAQNGPIFKGKFSLLKMDDFQCMWHIKIFVMTQGNQIWCFFKFRIVNVENITKIIHNNTIIIAKYVQMTGILLCIQLWTIFFKSRTITKIDFIILVAI